MKRALFWTGFLIILILIIWGLFAAMNKAPSNGISSLGSPAPVTASDHAEGPADAPVTLMEYGDFQCPACAEFAPIVERLFGESSSTLRVVFRHFPLPQHANAMAAAEAAEAASDQGAFWGMYKLLYAGQDSWANLSNVDAVKVFDGYAGQLGLNGAKFDADMNGTTTRALIQAEQANGQQLGIDYTPTFFVNGKIIRNPQSYEAFKAIIDAAAR